MARRMLARTTRHISWSRRLPQELGGASLLVSTEGGLKYLRLNLRDVDPLLETFARRAVRPGGTVWDIGANVGLFTFLAAGMVGHEGRVVALEPDPVLVVQLQRSARRNPELHVTVLPVAAAAEPGIAEFVVASNSRATSHLSGFGATQAGGVRYRQSVVVTTLDDLAASLPPPDVLKIDVERAEAEVLAGARRVLASARPVVLCEVGADARDAVAAELDRASYVLIDASTGREVDVPTYSTVAYPVERTEEARRVWG
ncbi:MAG: FkbM family methyltransferase [Actinomycetes bacterium]